MNQTREQKAVAILKDAVYQIKRYKYTVENMTFFLFGNMDCSLAYQDNVPVEKVIKEKGCRVCALGSLLASKAILFDKMQFGDVRYESPIDLCSSHLYYYFDKNNLSLMEKAFELSLTEGIYGCLPEGEYNKEVDKAVKFGERYEDPTDRLLAILRNMIRNKGVFVLPKRIGELHK